MSKPLITAFFYQTALGRVGIGSDGRAITNLFFSNTVRPDCYSEEETPLICRAAEQLSEYLSGSRKVFDLPLSPKGTDFERSVWSALTQIPYGEIRSYKDIASNIDNPKGVRAVGRANGRNPISIFIPCHRVIGADGRLTGYAGGIDLKKWLLDLEKGI